MSSHSASVFFVLFFFNDTATTEIYTLSLHDALPISFGIGPAHGSRRSINQCVALPIVASAATRWAECGGPLLRSEEHTSELQSRSDLVCRLLLEKKKKTVSNHILAVNESRTPSVSAR